MNVKSNKPATTDTDPVLRLIQYWLSARLMHDHVWEINEAYPGLHGIKNDGIDHVFLIYVHFWLSSLYVVSEGFIEVGLRDDVLDDLITEHLDSLRLYRNATFHFQRKPDKHVQFFDGQNRLNWAEELHSGFERFFKQHIRSLQVDDFLRWRASQKIAE